MGIPALLRRLLLTLGTLALSLGGVCLSLGAVPPGELNSLTLHSFKIIGAKTISPQEIEKEMYIKLPSFWPPWGKAPAFRKEDLEYDVERLKFLYRRHGFYHTEIKGDIHPRKDGKVDVDLVVKEGPWVKITRIDVTVVGAAPPKLSDLKNDWPMKVGDRFTEKVYEDLKNLYLNYLPNHGYPRVQVDGQVLLNEQANTARIQVKVKPGPLSYFGPTTIKDEKTLETPAKAILVKLTYKPGEVFSLNELFKSQRRLYATDLFSSVVLTPEDVPLTKHHIPITVELKEKKKRSLKVGLGYADEDKVRARLGMRWRNLGGGGRVLDLDSKYSSLGYRVEELFTNPVVLGTRYDFINQSGARRRDLPGFDDRAFFTQSRLERELPWETRFYLGHGLEFARPFAIPTATLIRLQGTEPEKLYRASFLMLGLRRDTVDNRIDPRRGGILSIANEFAPTFFGSQLQFVQTVAEARQYHTVGDSNFVLAGRLKVGVIQPIQGTSQIPIFRRFFSGGSTSVRGYKLDYLSPRNDVGDPIGGEAVLEGSIEGRFPIPLPVYKNMKLGGVVFFDFGNVFLKVRDLDLGQMKYAPGVGLRYLTPIGAVGIDVGFPINRIDYSRDRPYQIHFTVGYGF